MNEATADCITRPFVAHIDHQDQVDQYGYATVCGHNRVVLEGNSSVVLHDRSELMFLS